MKTIYDFTVKDRKGKDVSLKEYANEVLLIVNTATKCGFTPQYDELEKLYEQYHSQGFEILDFPCNQFGQQAPGTDESIHEFCKLNFGTDPQADWILDAIHEGILPLPGYNPNMNFTKVEKLRREKKGI